LILRDPECGSFSIARGPTGPIDQTAQALAMRSRIILLAAQSGSNKSIALKLSTTPHTVGKWRKRFASAGNDGLLDEPRPGTSRKLSDKQVELVLARTLESQPEAAPPWSTRDMAKACGLSQSSISRIWRAFSLAPHRALSIPSQDFVREL
jgi:transposase